jgi:hypothetical protein
LDTAIIEKMTLGSSGFAMRAPSHIQRRAPRKPFEAPIKMNPGIVAAHLSARHRRLFIQN